MVQNIQGKDIAWRTARLLVGMPVIPLDETDLIPEGLANRTAFPVGADIPSWDPKVQFGFRAIVLDAGYLYQYLIAEELALPGKHYYWYKSDLFDLNELLKLHEKMEGYRNVPEIKHPSKEFIQTIVASYKELEDVRAPIRDKILEYHKKKKVLFNIADANVPDPPRISVFEAIKPIKNDKGEPVFQVKTHMEPLLLLAAVRNYNKAKEAKELRGSDSENQDHLLDEIEHSSMCIISATNCLESYINYVLEKYLPEDAKSFEKSPSLIAKWLFVSSAFDSKYKFKPRDYPFSLFVRLVRLRNNMIHHKPTYTQAQGTTSEIASQYNADNARLAISAVKEMVTKLSENPSIPLPRWIQIDMGSDAHWDPVRLCLMELSDDM